MDTALRVTTWHIIGWYALNILWRYPIDGISSGTTGTYQRWSDLVGDQSFTFSNLLPYFKKSVNFTSPSYVKLGPGAKILYDPNAFEDDSGPLDVSYSNYRQPFTPFMAKALSALGLKQIAGLNSGSLLGYAWATYTISPENEERSSSETSFLQTALGTSTLQIYHNTIAGKIIFDDHKKATGVQVTTAESVYTIAANNEVILAAGVVSSSRVFKTIN